MGNESRDRWVATVMNELVNGTDAIEDTSGAHGVIDPGLGS